MKHKTNTEVKQILLKHYQAQVNDIDEKGILLDSHYTSGKRYGYKLYYLNKTKKQN